MQCVIVRWCCDVDGHSEQRVRSGWLDSLSSRRWIVPVPAAARHGDRSRHGRNRVTMLHTVQRPSRMSRVHPLGCAGIPRLHRGLVRWNDESVHPQDRAADRRERAAPAATSRSAYRRHPHRARHQHGGAMAGWFGGRGLRHGLLLGHRAAVLAAARGVHDRGRLRRRLHRRTRPTRRSAAAGPGTPRWSWWSSTRRRSATSSCSGVLGEPRSDPGHAPAQRPRHPVPVGDLHHHRRAGEQAAAAGTRTGVAAGRAGHGAITTEIAPAVRRSTTPRTTTSSTWTRTRAATATCMAPASPARSPAPRVSVSRPIDPAH